MQLWTDDMESMRGEAKAAVDASLGAIREMMGGAADPTEKLTRDEQVARARRQMESVYYPSDDAGVRWRVGARLTQSRKRGISLPGGLGRRVAACGSQ